MKYTSTEQPSHAASETISVLLVEDNAGDARLFKHHINTDANPAFPKATVAHVESMASAVQKLIAETWDIVLLDLGLPKSAGVDTLERFAEEMETQADIDPTPVVALLNARRLQY